MKFNNFFRVSLALQTLVGLGLFTVSMFMEYRVLYAFMATSLAALALTLTLESGKAVAIVWHRYLSFQPGIYPQTTRIASFAFRLGLLLLSLISSLLFLANRLDRPRLDAVRQADLAQIETQMLRELDRLNTQQQQQLQSLKERQQHQQERLASDYARRLDALEEKITSEMNNVVNGRFKGPRYRELERRISQLKRERAREMTKQANQHENTYLALATKLDQLFSSRREQVRTQYRHRYITIMKNSYDNDERVHAPYIVAFLSVIRAILPIDLEPMQFVFAFSLMISLLMELGIVVAFDNLTVVLLPALQSQHHQDLETGILRTQMTAEAQQENIRHASALDRIIAAAKRTGRKAQKTAEGMY